MSFYRTLHRFGSDEYIVEKSRFIGYAKPVETEEEARAFIDEIKEKHKDATHNVWAYTIGMNMNIQRYSDDGEPQGTAGIPVLEVVKKEDLRNVAVVVTRYFGGIKLGAGGLVRAYTRGAKIGLEAAKIVEKKLFTKMAVDIDYTLLGKIQNEISNRGYNLDGIDYTDSVCINLIVENEKIEEVENMMTEMSSATAVIRKGEQLYLSTIGGKIIK